jgi:hypothetical protein
MVGLEFQARLSKGSSEILPQKQKVWVNKYFCAFMAFMRPSVHYQYCKRKKGY